MKLKLKDGDLMTTGDAAEALGLSVPMVKKLRYQGRLPSIRAVGGLALYLARDVRALADQRAKAPTGRGRGQVWVRGPR